MIWCLVSPHNFHTFTLFYTGGGASGAQSDHRIRVKVINMSANKKTNYLHINVTKDTLQNVLESIQQKFELSQAIAAINVNNVVYLEDDDDIRVLQENDKLYFVLE
jgi:uncharacterized protein YcgL (UPF0745 family)